MIEAEDTGTLGARVRAARELRGLTLRRLASTTGLSPGFISQLENDRSNASVASLRNIAAALGVSAADLIDGNAKDSQGVLRKARRPRIHMADGLTKFSLSRAPLRNLEIYSGHLEPGGSTGAEHYRHGNAQEFVMCLKGRIELAVGEEIHVLDAGDSIEYLTSVEHGLRNIGDADAEVLWVISPPTG